MSELTPNLELFKYEPVADGAEKFNIQLALNDNFDKLDGEVGDLRDKLAHNIRNCVIAAGYVKADGELDIIDAEETTVTFEPHTQSTTTTVQETVKKTQKGEYTVTIPQNGNCNIAIVGGGGKKAGGISALNGDICYGGGGSGAAFVGVITLTAGTYKVKVGGVGEDSWIKKSDNTVVITAGKGGNSSYTGYTVSRGSAGVLNNHATVVSSTVSTNGQKGDLYYVTYNQYDGGGASKYKGYGKGQQCKGDNTAATAGYFAITYTKTITNTIDSSTQTVVLGSSSVDWKIDAPDPDGATPEEVAGHPLVCVKSNGEIMTLTGVNNDLVTDLADGTYMKFVGENGDELISATKYFESYIEPDTPSDGDLWFKVGNPSVLYQYDGDESEWVESDKIHIGTVKVKDGAVLKKENISLFKNQFNLTLNATDKRTITSLAYPSNTYDDLTLLATGSTYTAPADGWFAFNKHGSEGQLAAFEAANGLTWIAQLKSASDCRVSCPVGKGDEVTLWYNASGTTNCFRFIYAKGVK